jgi:hypothetical protein
VEEKEERDWHPGKKSGKEGNIYGREREGRRSDTNESQTDTDIERLR